MQVITLSSAALDKACESLSKIIIDNLACAPDAVIGIRTGGEVVADMLAKHLGVSTVAYANASRPGKKSRSCVAPLLKSIPTKVADWLRRIESVVLRFRPGKQRSIAFDATDGITTLLSKDKHSNLLIVDDAVDSGITLNGVVAHIATLYPDANILTATITVTTPNPVEMPDFSLFRNTLIRFPWSADYKPED
jgi:hypoxanthine phosphoribosyltransferase